MQYLPTEKIIEEKYPLLVYAESYKTLILNKTGFLNYQGCRLRKILKPGVNIISI